MGVRPRKQEQTCRWDLSFPLDLVQTIPADSRCIQEHVCAHTDPWGHVLTYKGSVSICCEHLVHAYIRVAVVLSVGGRGSLPVGPSLW